MSLQVPPTPNAFVVNIGDLLSRWTNDLYLSTQHRVTSPPPGVHRYSIPFFSQGHPDYIVQVIESCIEEGTEAKYKPIRAEDYLRLKFESTYSMGKP
jgi:isopenicillin N synthase-like dioxygenase